MLAITLDHLGSSHGQHDFVLRAMIDGAQVGCLNFSEFQGQPAVSWLEVDPDMRRRHVATRLIRSLQARYPESVIDLGGLTDDGYAAISRMPSRFVVNEAVRDAQEELGGLWEKISVFERQSESVRLGTASVEDFDFSEWNDTADRIEDLEYVILTQPKTFRFFICEPGPDMELTEQATLRP